MPVLTARAVALTPPFSKSAHQTRPVVHQRSVVMYLRGLAKLSF